MTSTIRRIGHSCLISLVLPGILTLAAQTTAANEIQNTATFGGDNLQRFDTNRVTVTPTGIASLEIIKTGDRAAAEPGDTVLYQVSIRNTGGRAINNLTLTDTLPLGLQFVEKSLQASVTDGNTTAPVTISGNRGANRTVNINFSGSLPARGTLNVVYAALVTPDAVRGTGRNLAVANSGGVRSNTASHLLRIRPGILSDCATLIGRVFVDKNFDGEQQPGEPGVPNAVIYMDDGNRIVTDANGLFSMANVVAGNRSGTLDVTSIPGYTLAPNQYDIEKNSQSRLVRLAPGGMARMNFAVTPASGEVKK